jgi:type II secretory pathway pseudopilin PulG
MVVVGIILLLMGIAIPVSSGVLKHSQAKATEATLETVKNAIEVFASEKPLHGHGFVFDPASGPGDTWGGNCYELFGPLPPSPVAWLSHKSAGRLSGLAPSFPETNPLVNKNAPCPTDTGDKFKAILEYYIESSTYTTGDADSRERYATSECLLIFLRTYSPQARAIVAKLGKALTNEDRDTIVRNNQAEELFELRDTWGNPVRYTVHYMGKVVGAKLYRWELRSAGADGKFADVMPLVDNYGTYSSIPNPFSAKGEEDTGDDVIVSGSIKTEN